MMNAKRFHLLMILLVALSGIGILASVFIGNSILKKQAVKLNSAKLNSAVLDEEQSSLAQAKKDVAKYSELEREAKIIVPQDKDQAEAVREIVNIASSSHIALSGITFPASSLGQSTRVAAPAGTDTATPIKSSPSVTQVQASGIPGVYIMPITVQQDNAATPVPYTSLITFLSNLEKNRRTSQVSSINIQPFPKNFSLINFTLVVDVYIKP